MATSSIANNTYSVHSCSEMASEKEAKLNSGDFSVEDMSAGVSSKQTCRQLFI